MAIGQSPDTEGAKPNHRSNRLVNDEASRDDIDTGRYADRAAVVREAFASAKTALGSVARFAPRHQVELLLEERIKVGISGSYQGFASIALSGRDHSPILAGR